MKIGIMSDLHCEFDPRGSAATMDGDLDGHPSVEPLLVELEGAVDLLLLGGDTDVGMRAMTYASYAADYVGCPVIVIAGNHEFYEHSYDGLMKDFRNVADALPNVHFLENDEKVFERDGSRVRLLGCSLWTDYALYAESTEAIDLTMQVAQSRLADHRLITMRNADRFRPENALELHRHSLQWLARALAEPFEGTTVVLTHHAVSERSVSDKHKSDALSGAFASNLDEFVRTSGAALWVHGHTHHDVDYMLGNTRVLSRQRGYPDEANEWFSPAIVEL